MTPEEIRNVIIDILNDIAPDEDLSDLNDSVDFRDQLELDSMDFLDIVMELRKRYSVNVPEEGLSTIGFDGQHGQILDAQNGRLRRFVISLMSLGRHPLLLSAAALEIESSVCIGVNPKNHNRCPDDRIRKIRALVRVRVPGRLPQPVFKSSD